MSTKRLVKRLLNFKGVVIDSVAIREVNGAESVVVSVHLTKGFALRDPSTGKREPKYGSPPQIRRLLNVTDFYARKVSLFSKDA